jgi:hypothetical protein
MDPKYILNYWIDSADNDFKAMLHLFEKGDYRGPCLSVI